MYPQITLHAGREKSVYFYHPWIFSRAIKTIPPKVQDGDIINVLAHDGKMLGTAYFNSKSQIALRLLSFFEEVNVDQRFLEEKFRSAYTRRLAFLDPYTNAYRLVFSESDGLPGLIVDRYKDFLVIQIHTLGMDKLKDVIVKALKAVFQPKGIYERSDVDVRKKEGLKSFPKGVFWGEEPPESYEIEEHGLKFFVDIQQGQKTGFFLDQRANRLTLRNYCKNKEVLNLFSYSGGFSLSALQGGASKVTSVDISQSALDLAQKNFELNGYDAKKHSFAAQDVFDYLDLCLKEGRTFDLVVVDPPAFVKSKDHLKNALQAYIRLNEKALKVVKKGGIIASSSCSSHVSRDLFQMVLFKAALKTGDNLTIIETKTQPFDHPLNIRFPEGEYLKFFVCRKD